MTEDTKQQLRLMLATAPVMQNKNIDELKEIYEWVVGKESKIVAVSETDMRVIKS